MRASGGLATAILAVAIAACGPATPAARPAASAAPPPAAAAGATSVADFTRLREQWGARADFAARCEDGRPEALQELSPLAQQGQWEQVLAVAQPWTEQCPVDIFAQQISATALSKLGREPEVLAHVRMYRGLVDSILASGDGRTPGTAFVVISISEEYAVLRVFQLKPTRQALLDGGIDAFTVEADGGTASIYFNPAAHWRRLGRTFEPTGSAP